MSKPHQITCLVAGFGTYTIRLLSANLKRQIELVPYDFDGLDPLKVTAESLLDEIHATRRKHGLSRTAVLGFSFGGMIALDYALAYPEHVSHVVAVCSPPYWTSGYKARREEFQERDLSPTRAALLRENQSRFEKEYATMSPEKRFIRYTVAQSPLYWYDPMFDESAYWEGLSVDLGLINHIDAEVYREHDQTGRFGEITAAVFAAFGRYDYATPYDSWNPYRGAFRNVTTSVFPLSAHDPMIEEQPAFDDQLLTWFAREG